MNQEKTKFLTITEFANQIGVHIQTVRKWDKNNKLPAHHKTPGGNRMYSPEQVTKYFNGEYNN